MVLPEPGKNDATPPVGAAETAAPASAPVGGGATSADWSGETALPPPLTQGEPSARYAFLGVLGRGGMGEVHQVHDRVLNRVVAMKTLRPEYGGHLELNARFLEEAQIAAQLDHPAIVPIYDHGRLPDGRLWLTMKLVRGVPFAVAIQRVHTGVRQGALPRIPGRMDVSKARACISSGL